MLMPKKRHKWFVFLFAGAARIELPQSNSKVLHGFCALLRTAYDDVWLMVYAACLAGGERNIMKAYIYIYICALWCEMNDQNKTEQW